MIFTGRDERGHWVVVMAAHGMCPALEKGGFLTWSAAEMWGWQYLGWIEGLR